MIPSVSEVIKNGNQFMESLRSTENKRYLSWEHCYSAFAKYKGKEPLGDSLDYLCLHLTCYLSSWGMYRGSSFLLQKDYKVHKSAIRKLMLPKYHSLWAAKCADFINIDNNFQKILDTLIDELRNIYSEIRKSAKKSINREIPKQTISDILITKILLGTLGCVPAYDRYFIGGVKKCKVASTIFGPKSIRALSKYYVENSGAFEDLRKESSKGRVEYSQMKVLDMCFWQIGYKLDGNNS